MTAIIVNILFLKKSRVKIWKIFCVRSMPNTHKDRQAKLDHALVINISFNWFGQMQLPSNKVASKQNHQNLTRLF